MAQAATTNQNATGKNVSPEDLNFWEFRSDADIRKFASASSKLASDFANVYFMASAELASSLRDIPPAGVWGNVTSAVRARRVANVCAYAGSLQVAAMKESARIWEVYKHQFAAERAAARRKTKRSSFKVTGD